jgi:CheY-like chemotaxis protein
MAHPDSLSCPSALVVDDNREVADLLVEILALHGIPARPAYGGAEALSLARGFRPDVLLLNLDMPDIDGYAVASALRAAGDPPYLIAFSSQDDSGTRRRAHDAGFDLYLRKPAPVDVLLDAVRRAGAAAHA